MTKCDRPNCPNQAVTMNKLAMFFEEVCHEHRMSDAERKTALSRGHRKPLKENA